MKSERAGGAPGAPSAVYCASRDESGWTRAPAAVAMTNASIPTAATPSTITSTSPWAAQNPAEAPDTPLGSGTLAGRPPRTLTCSERAVDRGRLTSTAYVVASRACES
jgi:hypothetical protein